MCRIDIVILLILFSSGCGILSGNKDESSEGEITQFYLSENPKINLIRASNSPYSIDSLALEFYVTARDSTPHLKWLPTEVLVETSRGYEENLVLPPHACLETKDNTDEYPYSYNWLACAKIGINSDVVLTLDQIDIVESKTKGRLNYVREYKQREGAQYYFDISTGRTAIQNAINEIKGLDFIEGEIYHPFESPRCVLSDIAPRPPCPPWWLNKWFEVSFEQNYGDAIPVSEDGWVKVTYTEPNDNKLSTTFSFSAQ